MDARDTGLWRAVGLRAVPALALVPVHRPVRRVDWRGLRLVDRPTLRLDAGGRVRRALRLGPLGLRAPPARLSSRGRARACAPSPPAFGGPRRGGTGVFPAGDDLLVEIFAGVGWLRRDPVRAGLGATSWGKDER